MPIKIIFFGDIIGKAGRKAVAKILPVWKKKYKPDLVLANAENLAHGTGITEKTLDECLEAGVDCFTSGNHVWKKKEGWAILDQKDSPIIRPANYPNDVPGRGEKILNVGTKKGLVINLLGRVFFEANTDCPFREADEILKEYKKERLSFILVDFHTEATSEKVAMGHYLDGQVTAVLGTHTHIPTADNYVTDSGTAYVSDIGMVGLKDSVIGANKEVILKKFLTQIPQGNMHDVPDNGRCIVNAVMIDIDPKTKKATSIKRLDQDIEI